jgi:hypothetical protein
MRCRASERSLATVAALLFETTQEVEQIATKATHVMLSDPACMCVLDGRGDQLTVLWTIHRLAPGAGM